MYKFANIALIAILVICLNTTFSQKSEKKSEKVDIIQEVKVLPPSKGTYHQNMLIQKVAFEEGSQVQSKKTQTRKKIEQKNTGLIRGVVLETNFAQIKKDHERKVHIHKNPQDQPKRQSSRSIKKSQNSSNRYL